MRLWSASEYTSGGNSLIESNIKLTTVKFWITRETGIQTTCLCLQEELFKQSYVISVKHNSGINEHLTWNMTGILVNQSISIPVFFCIEMGFCHHQRGGNHTVTHIIKSPYSTSLPEIVRKHNI